MIPYTIINYDEASKNVTVRLKDLLGNKHDLTVTAQGLSNQEMGIGYIQDNFSNLTEDERELFLTGIPANFWNKMFKDE
jgi:glutamate dehydrogenase/leucine dehydrogenase